MNFSLLYSFFSFRNIYKYDNERFYYATQGLFRILLIHTDIPVIHIYFLCSIMKDQNNGEKMNDKIENCSDYFEKALQTILNKGRRD